MNLAVDANLDLLRIHAHVTRLELYDAADAAGLLLWQDLPLQWGYARGTRKQAVRQAREMVDLLGTTRAIALWCAHNEPLAIDLQPGEPIRARDVAQTAASMFLPTWNKDVLDRSIARALHKADPTRGRSIAHSGCSPGSPQRRHRHALLLRLVPRHDGRPRAGAARVPAPRPLRHRVRRAGRARHRGLHGARALARPGLGRPRRAPRAARSGTSTSTCRPPISTPSARGATRPSTTRPRSIQLQIEDLRRLKHGPTGGFCHSASPTATRRSPGRCSTTPGCRRPATARSRDACRPCSRCSSPAPGSSTWSASSAHRCRRRGRGRRGRPAPRLDRRRPRRRDRRSSATLDLAARRRSTSSLTLAPSERRGDQFVRRRARVAPYRVGLRPRARFAHSAGQRGGGVSAGGSGHEVRTPERAG